MSCVAQRRGVADFISLGRQRPALSAPDYLALLNQRLQAHPMYLEGMAFPVASDDDAEDEEERLPLALMVRDTRWDEFGVFASVIDEVQGSFDLATPVVSPAAVACRAKTVRLRPVLR